MKKKVLLCNIFCCLLLSCLNSQSVYTEKEMETLPRQELMVAGEKVFYLIADASIGEFTRKAQIFTVKDSKYTVYMTIKGSVVKNRDGSVFIDGSKYGSQFYAWKFEKAENSPKYFYLHCYWDKGDKPSSTDPLLFGYDMKKDLLYIWRPDPSEY